MFHVHLEEALFLRRRDEPLPRWDQYSQPVSFVKGITTALLHKW